MKPDFLHRQPVIEYRNHNFEKQRPQRPWRTVQAVPWRTVRLQMQVFHEKITHFPLFMYQPSLSMIGSTQQARTKNVPRDNRSGVLWNRSNQGKQPDPVFSLRRQSRETDIKMAVWSAHQETAAAPGAQRRPHMSLWNGKWNVCAQTPFHWNRKAMTDQRHL
jgi:hypothetical protein